MMKTGLFFCAMMAGFGATKAQGLPDYIQKLPLKHHQLIQRWQDGIRDGYCIYTYLEDGVMNECTIDSLATDSKIFMDSVLNTPAKECPFWRFKYVNKCSLWGTSYIFLEYWLKNGRVVKVDSIRADNFDGRVKLPLLPNQYFSWRIIKNESTDINDFIIHNIIPKNEKLFDSLNRDSRMIFLKLTKTLSFTDLAYTTICISYVDQFSGDIIKEYKYPIRKGFSPEYYLRQYENDSLNPPKL